MSHAFLDGEMTQLGVLSRVIPPIFLIVAAFLVNMVLGRLIKMERTQIGLLKAIGYGSGSIACARGSGRGWWAPPPMPTACRPSTRRWRTALR